MLGPLRVDEDHGPQIVLLVEAGFDTLELQVFLQLLQLFLQLLDFLRRSILVAFKIDTLGQVELRQQGCDLFFADALI